MTEREALFLIQRSKKYNTVATMVISRKSTSLKDVIKFDKKSNKTKGPNESYREELLGINEEIKRRKKSRNNCLFLL